MFGKKKKIADLEDTVKRLEKRVKELEDENVNLKRQQELQHGRS